MWVSPELSLEKVEDLINRFLKVVKLSAEDLKKESESWASSAVVVRSLERRVSSDMMTKDFQSHVELKGGVAGFSLEKGFALRRVLPWFASRRQGRGI